MSYQQIIKKLKSYANAKNIAGMAHFGITGNVIGGPNNIKMRQLAKEIGQNHQLAQQLWNSRIHEARMLAIFIDDPQLVTEKQMEKWVKDFDNWGICDGACMHLFDRTPWAYEKAKAWSKRQEEYVKRAGFALMAVLAVHDKTAADKKMLQFFPYIKKQANDSRNYVKKAVNWALRQIGKRNKNLRQQAINLALEIQQLDSSSAKWIAADALRELKSVTF